MLLISDFFDSGSANDKADDEEPMDTKAAEDLPEGFFDDPKLDAKVWVLYKPLP